MEASQIVLAAGSPPRAPGLGKRLEDGHRRDPGSTAPQPGGPGASRTRRDRLAAISNKSTRGSHWGRTKNENDPGR